MLLKNIKKWDTEFLNPGMISFPTQDTPRRLLSNIDYFFSNYVIIFVLLSTLSLVFHFSLLIEVAVSGLLWQYAQTKSSVWKGILTNRDIGVIFVANVLLIIFLNGYALFCCLGTGVLALIVHAFLWDESQHRKSGDSSDSTKLDEEQRINQSEEHPHATAI